jgi:hypothetical protein
MLWKTAKPFATTGRPRAASGCCYSGETDFAMAGFSPRLIRQGRTIPENPTAVERAAALGESATKRSATRLSRPQGSIPGQSSASMANRSGESKRSRCWRSTNLTHRGQPFCI